MTGSPVLEQRPALDIDYHQWLASGLQHAEELLLTSHQIEGGPVEALATFHVAHLHGLADSRPRFLVRRPEISRAGAANHRHDDIGLESRLPCLLEIARRRIAHGTSPGVCHLGSGNLPKDAVEHGAHPTLGLGSRVVAQHIINVMRVRSHHRQPQVTAERQQIAVVLEQRDALASRLPGQRHMVGGAHLPGSCLGVDIGMVEKAHLELHCENAPHRLVDDLDAYLTFLHRVDKLREGIGT